MPHCGDPGQKSCVHDGKLAELILGPGQRLKMDAVHADKREIFATTKEDLEHGIAG